MPYGSLMCAIYVTTRQEITHVVGLVSMYMENPWRDHWTIGKKIFRYLQGTNGYVICHQVDGTKKL